MKLVPAPGAKLIGPSTRRDRFCKAAMVLVTYTLFNVMFPVFVTVPVTTFVCPGCNKPTGHAFTTSMLGLFVEAQEALAVFDSDRPQVVLARTVKVSAYGPHESCGTV